MLQGLYCLVKEISRHLVINSHYLADLFIPEALVYFKIDNLLLAVGQLVDRMDNPLCRLPFFFATYDKLVMADGKGCIVLHVFGHTHGLGIPEMAEYLILECF